MEREEEREERQPDYPKSAEEVIELAANAGIVMDQKQSEEYFITRMASDWIDAAGRKIKPNRIGYDLKRWTLRKSGQCDSGKRGLSESTRRRETASMQRKPNYDLPGQRGKE